MKKLLLLLTGAFIYNGLSAQMTSKSLTVGSENRTYLQYLPTGFDPNSESVSVVIALHGLGSTMNDLPNTGLNLIADTARIICFYPQGLNNNWGQAAWNNGTILSSNVDDLGFMNQLIDSAILNYGADPSRVYFAGFSMGSIMSYHVACALNNRVAAIGCMSGTMATSDINSCVPAYKTPVIHFHGTSDGTVPYNSGALPSLSLVPQTLAFWQNVHSCDATADSTQIPDSASDGLTVDRFVYDNCDPTASLEHWRINGGTHTYFYQPTNDFTEIIETWRFLRKWQHNSPASAGLNDKSISSIRISPNPSQGKFKIESGVQQEFVVLTIEGKQIGSGKLNIGDNELDLTHLTSGVYLIKINDSSERIIIE